MSVAIAAGGGISTIADLFAAFQLALPGLAAAAPYLVGIAAAIGLVVAGVKSYKKAHPSLESLQNDAEEAKQEFEKMQSTVEETQKRIDELNELKISSGLSSAEQEELDNLISQNEQYERQLELLEEIAKQKERAAKEKETGDAMQSLSDFLGNAERETVFGAQSVWNRFTVKNASGLGGLLNAIDDYTAAREALESANEDLSAAELEGKDTEALDALRDNIEQKSKTLDGYANVLMSFKEFLVDIRGSLTDEETIATVDGYIDMISETMGQKNAGKTFDKFKRDLKKLSSETNKTFNKVEDIVGDKSEAVQQWLKETGYSVDDLTTYFSRMADEVESASGSSISTIDSITNLTSLRDELQKTTKALEDYQNATADDESAYAKQYDSAYEAMVADIEAGRTGSNKVRAGQKLLYSKDTLEGLGWDLKQINEHFQNDAFLKALFDGDAEDYGARLVRSIRDFPEIFGDAVEVTEDLNGNLQFTYKSVQAMSDNSGYSTGLIGALLKDLSANGVEVMMSQEEFSQLAGIYSAIETSVTNANNGVANLKSTTEQFIAYLALAGNDEFAIMSILQALKEAGAIDYDEEALAGYISSIVTAAAEYNESPAELQVNTTAEAAVAEVVAAGQEIRGELKKPAKVNVGANTTQADAALDVTSEKIAAVEGTHNVIIHYTENGDIPKADEGLAIYRVIHGLDIETGVKPGETDYSGAAPGSPIISPKIQPTFTPGQSSFDDAKQYIEEQLSGVNSDVEIEASDETSEGANAAKDTIESTIPNPYAVRIVAAGGSGGWLRMGAFASGTKSAPGGPTLVNELGPELISQNGEAFIAGGGKPTVVDLDKGAIVLTADETKRALGSSSSKKTIPAAANAFGHTTTKTTYVAPAAGSAKSVPKAIGNALLSIVEDVFTPIRNTTASAFKYIAATTPGGKNTGNGGNGSGSGGAKEAVKELTEVMDWIEVAIDRVERRIKSLSRTAESTFKSLANRLSASNDQIAAVSEEIAIQQQGYERYMQEAESIGLPEDLAKLVRDGTVDISRYDKDTKKLIDDYKKWYDKAIDCSDAVQELHESLAELYEGQFESVQQSYEGVLTEIEHRATMIEKNLDMIDAKSYIGNASFYEQLVKEQEASIYNLKWELSSLNAYFEQAMKSGEIQERSEAWYSMKEAIGGVEESIADANIQLIEYQKNMRDLTWEYFDYAQERFSQLTQEANFLIDLMQNDKLFDDNGQFTGVGDAMVGLRVMNYNAYMAQADSYAKEMQKINQDIAKDPYDTKLIERREELLKLQQQSIQAAESEKDAVQSLVSDGINQELDALKKLIDAYEDSIDSAKDLYDYQQKVTEKTGDIATIQKQLAAYAGDTSEENRARVQKLNKDLENAQKDLQETEHQQSISDQKKLLDDLYNEYEEMMNARLDDVDELMREMIDSTNANLVNIRDELISIGNDVGYTISSGTLGAFESGGFANYNKVFEGFTSVNDYLSNIYENVNAMARASGAVKAYASGGLVDYTGLAMVHGTASRPELMLNAGDTANFLAAASMLRTTPMLSALSSKSYPAVDISRSGGGGVTIGNLEVGVNIDHVQDYNDMLAQMRDDPKFERLIETLSLDRAVGKSSFRKNNIKI